jgi:hypothetical protein
MGQMDWAKSWTSGMTAIPPTDEQWVKTTADNLCRPHAQRAWNDALKTGADAETAFNKAWAAHEAECREAALAYLRERKRKRS